MIAQTDRLLIRAMTQDDLAAFTRLNQDTAVMQYFPQKLTDEQAQNFLDKIIDHQLKKGFSLYSVELKATGEWIGFGGLWTVPFDAFFTPAIEIIGRLDSRYQKQGLALEASVCVLNQAFEQHRLPKVVSFTATVNVPSLQAMERMGFERIGQFAHPALPSDHWLSEHVLYQMTISQWQALNA